MIGGHRFYKHGHNVHHIAAKDKQKAPKLESGENTGLASAGPFYNNSIHQIRMWIETKAERGEKKFSQF